MAATIARNYVKFNERNSAWKRAPLVISCEFMRESFGEEKKGEEEEEEELTAASYRNVGILSPLDTTLERQGEFINYNSRNFI